MPDVGEPRRRLGGFRCSAPGRRYSPLPGNDPKHLGAKPGILMALHSWSRALLVHVHLHCLVTGRGMASDGQWKKPSRDGFLVPDDRLSARFWRKFCDALERRIKAGKVVLPLDMARIDGP